MCIYSVCTCIDNLLSMTLTTEPWFPFSPCCCWLYSYFLLYSVNNLILSREKIIFPCIAKQISLDKSKNHRQPSLQLPIDANADSWFFFLVLQWIANYVAAFFIFAYITYSLCTLVATHSSLCIYIPSKNLKMVSSRLYSSCMYVKFITQNCIIV